MLSEKKITLKALGYITEKSIYINHGLHPESSRWAEDAQAFATGMGVTGIPMGARHWTRKHVCVVCTTNAR